MKKLIAVFVIIGVILATVLVIYVSQKGAGKAPPYTSPTVVGVRPPTPAPTVSSPIKPGDWQEFRSDRETTLNSNPELTSEYKAILTEMDSQQKDLEAAMIKADPKVAPLIAKLETLRRHPVKPPIGPPSSKPLPGALTQDDMSHLRTARLAALKANPDFDAKSKQLGARLMSFQQKLSAAMVRSDPKVATVLTKMGEPTAASQTPPSPLPAKSE